MTAATTTPPASEARDGAQIDPRGPRFNASITAALMLTVIGLALTTAAAPLPSLAERLAEPAFVLGVVVAAIFAWGAIAGVHRNPWGLLFRTLLRPRLAAPSYLESAAPPRFAQGVGLLVTAVGIVLHLAGVPFGLVAAASAAFIAAFLNAVFNFCLGCQIYLLLARLRAR
jgi:hypothetical protein